MNYEIATINNKKNNNNNNYNDDDDEESIQIKYKFEMHK